MLIDMIDWDYVVTALQGFHTLVWRRCWKKTSKIQKHLHNRGTFLVSSIFTLFTCCVVYCSVDLFKGHFTQNEFFFFPPHSLSQKPPLQQHLHTPHSLIPLYILKGFTERSVYLSFIGWFTYDLCQKTKSKLIFFFKAVDAVFWYKVW